MQQSRGQRMHPAKNGGASMPTTNKSGVNPGGSGSGQRMNTQVQPNLSINGYQREGSQNQANNSRGYSGDEMASKFKKKNGRLV